MSKDEDTLKDAREEYAEGEEAWSDVKDEYEADYRFGRLAEQWPTDVQQQRKDEGRPCLTVNRQPAFIRQVVNDGRQNRPAIKVRPVNSGADQKTAEVMAGIVRHIEAISDADVVYDTALENACSGGFGFGGVDAVHSCDDNFDMDLNIIGFSNPLAVTWDAHTTAEDSSDWNYAFVSEEMTKDIFEHKYPDAESEAGDFANDANIRDWFNGDTIRLSKYYKRTETTRKILLLSDGQVVDGDKFKADEEAQQLYQAMGVTVVRERTVPSYKITIRLISGREVLETKSWAGTTIPIVPCYGETLNIQGERKFRSLIHNAKDSQKIHNYSRSAATEMVSLAPKVPFIGEQGAFDADLDKWESINNKSWPYIEYAKGKLPPQRQPFTGVPEGAMNEAAAALEDMKQIIGIHDASLGLPGNEISGKAIRYRQHEGDVSTFHFIDNQHRMVRGIGRILLEMIPQVYTPGRVVRIIGQDGKPQHVQLGGQKPPSPMGAAA